jgi:HSP20 family protein
MKQGKQLNGWKNNFDSFFGDDFWNGFEGIFSHNHFPQLNMYETTNELLCILSVPGLKSIDDIELYVSHNRLEIRGRLAITFNGFRLTEEEIFQGNFERKIELPYPVKEDKVQASYQNGLLIIHLHRLINGGLEKHKISIQQLDD